MARFPLEPGDVGPTRRWLESEAQAARELLGRRGSAPPSRSRSANPVSGLPASVVGADLAAGTSATDEDPGGSVAFAHDLAEFIQRRASHRHCAAGRSTEGPGGELRSHDAWMETCFEHSEGLLDVPQLRRCGRHAEAAAQRRRGRDDPRRPDPRQRARLPRAAGRGHRRRRPGTGRSGAGSRRRLASARGRPAAGAARRPRLRRPRVGARQGMGLRAGDGRGLVLRREQPGDEPDGPPHPARLMADSGRSSSRVRP